MNINEYREQLIQDVGIAAQSEITDVNIEFLKKTINILIDAEEFFDFTECYYEGIAKNKRNMQIDGFSIDKVDGTYIIFITDYRGLGEENIVISKTQIDTLYRKMEAFVENSINGNLGKNSEESSEYYEFIKNIEENINDIRKFRFYILTDAYLSLRVKNIKKDNILGVPVDLNVWDINRFFMLASSNLGKENIEIDFNKYGYEGIPAVKAGSFKNSKVDIKIEEEGLEKYEISYDSYLAVIPGNILNEIYLEYDARLLEGNVRTFLGFRKINAGIKNTILNYPKMFFAYNNGIAATATEIETIMTNEGLKISKIKNLQIINGAQTTASIANTLLSNKNTDISAVYVPMKISVLDSKISEKIIPNISKYANTQNKINASDFFSNHPFHIRIEDYSRRMLVNPTNGNQFPTFWFYERVRGQYEQGRFRLKRGSKIYKDYERKFPKKQVIKKTDLAKYINLYNEKPDIVSKGSQKSMVEFAKIIDETWNKKDKEINEEYFKKVVVLAILFRDTDNIIKNSLWYKNVHSYKANVIYYSLAYLFYYIRINYKGYSLNFNKLWDEQCTPSVLEKNLEELTKITFTFITSPENNIANVTEWCKKELCWTKAKENIKFKFSDEFIDILISNEEINSKEKAAKKSREVESEIDLLNEIIKLGNEYWLKVYKWGKERNLITDLDESILTLAINIETTGKIPSNKQCKYIMLIQNRMFEEGMPKYI